MPSKAMLNPMPFFLEKAEGYHGHQRGGQVHKKSFPFSSGKGSLCWGQEEKHRQQRNKHCSRADVFEQPRPAGGRKQDQAQSRRRTEHIAQHRKKAESAFGSMDVPFSVLSEYTHYERIGNEYENLFVVALFTGARESELNGLSWDCVDFFTHIANDLNNFYL